ncbi:hypothetical protein [Natronoglycomyces albus]|uniref:Uncharacterized protein n=1 Tax=Natronoglycomyces albus TaxID=2811108 RepID=A0A895XVU8_9ACTN|nr:hypothetical protein [Natronoglycomyces albus]QSB06656.1 hypothetical protein JQS30_07105 [Natronoglycomyces albus]
MATPRSAGSPRRDGAYLAVWLRSWHSGLVSLDQALDAVVGTSQTPGLTPQRDILLNAAGQQQPWTDLANLLHEAPATQTQPAHIRLLLPVPGDIRGLGVAPDLRGPALAAGFAVLAGRLALTRCDQTHRSGSGDQWTMRTWQYFPLPLDTPAEPRPLSLGEADVVLTEATNTSLAMLEALPAPAAEVVPNIEDEALPPGFGPRSRRLFARALAILTLLDHTVLDQRQGPLAASATADVSHTRHEALTALHGAARQALIAACAAAMESP